MNDATSNTHTHTNITTTTITTTTFSIHIHVIGDGTHTDEGFSGCDIDIEIIRGDFTEDNIKAASHQKGGSQNHTV